MKGKVHVLLSGRKPRMEDDKTCSRSENGFGLSCFELRRGIMTPFNVLGKLQRHGRSPSLKNFSSPLMPCAIPQVFVNKPYRMHALNPGLMSPRLKLHHPRIHSASAYQSSMPLNKVEPILPFRPILEQHPMPAVTTSYSVPLFQMHLGIALAARVPGCGSCDVCGGCVEV